MPDIKRFPGPSTRILGFALLAASALVGCGSTMTAVLQDAYTLVKRPQQDNTEGLNPAYQYLRVTVKNQVAFFTLGDREQHPDGPVEVYYGGGREVIRLQRGRLFGIAGLTTEWRNVSFAKTPAWNEDTLAQTPISFERTRDVMPGYRMAIQDTILLNKIPTPRTTALKDIAADSLSWFEERIQRDAGNQSASAPSGRIESLAPARYAVAFAKGAGFVIYAEQCISTDFCFTWQRWTLRKP